MNLIFDGFVIDFDKLGRPMGIEIYHDASKFVDIESAHEKNGSGRGFSIRCRATRNCCEPSPA